MAVEAAARVASAERSMTEAETADSVGLWGARCPPTSFYAFFVPYCTTGQAGVG
jgi:hypothetical protein